MNEWIDVETKISEEKFICGTVINPVNTWEEAQKMMIIHEEILNNISRMYK